MLALYRFIYFIIYTLYILLKVYLKSLYINNTEAYALKKRKEWAIQILKVLGVEIVIKNESTSSNCIYISNHRSYLDPIVLLTELDFYPVMKSSVLQWPLIGQGAKLTNVIAIDRNNLDSRKNTLIQVYDTLEKNNNVLIFPEGTTSIAPTILPFKEGVFRLASSNKIKIVPICIEYENYEVAWVGDDLFVPHFFKIFATKKTKVDVRIGKEIIDNDAANLLYKSKNWIANQSAVFLRNT